LDCYSFTAPKTEVVRKAVIPVAGQGTRMYPASKAVRKELFPVIDADGHAKPVVLVVIEELVKSGIDEICLIVHPGDEELFLSLLQPMSEESMLKLPANLRSYENKLSEISKKITFAYQSETLGFGHAVLQSSHFAGSDPVLLLLGDHLYSSKSNRSCFNQMIDAYEETKKLTIGLFEIPPEETPKYGVVRGEFTNDDKKLVKLDTLVEKPTVEYAKMNLGVEDKQLAVFLYVLTPDVYKTLNQTIKNGKTELGEIQLTPSLDEVAKTSGAYGVAIDGSRFDIGLPEKYRETITNYGL